jgi:hypothetical protein
MALAILSAVPAGCPVVLDGLAFGALPEAGALRCRTPLIALVHQPPRHGACGHRPAGASRRCGRIGTGAAPPDQRSCRTKAARHEGSCSGGATPHLARFCPAFCRRNRDGRMSGFPRTAWHCASCGSYSGPRAGSRSWDPCPPLAFPLAPGMDRQPEPRTRSRQTKLRRGPGSPFCLVEQGYGVCGARDERAHAAQQQQLVDQLGHDVLPRQNHNWGAGTLVPRRHAHRWVLLP